MRYLPLVLGVVMIVIGALWTFQGLGYVKGSPMTGVELWAIVGPVVAGLGVAVLLVALRRRPQR
jgi:ABC-type proline/glycine betaine transport system permease subunit